MTTLSERLKECISDSGRGKSQAGLARYCGIKPPSVTAWFNGETKSLEGKNLLRAADYFGVNPSWLESGRGRKYLKDSANVVPGPDIRGTVPLISHVQAGEFEEVIDNLHPGEGERVTTSYPVRKHTFALRVVGDSMEPDFPEGAVLIVEPEMEPRPGDFVIARNGDSATFKQLMKDGPDWYLKPLNHRYPMKSLGDSHVIGVVLEVVRRLR